MATLFQNYPVKPKGSECDASYTILRNSHDASSSFLDIFEKTRKARKAKGAPTDEEQDLLRAMLAFACAGLDAMIKQLIRDTLPLIINQSKGAGEKFRNFIEKRLYKGEEIDHKLIAEVLCDVAPRDRLITVLINELTSNSLQSADAVFRAGSFFNIPSAEIFKDASKLKTVFEARNEIIHEMDVDFNQSNRNRRPRSKKSMIDNTNLIFCVSNNFLKKAEHKLNHIES